jgi:hypothetical protein
MNPNFSTPPIRQDPNHQHLCGLMPIEVLDTHVHCSVNIVQACTIGLIAIFSRVRQGRRVFCRKAFGTGNRLVEKVVSKIMPLPWAVTQHIDQRLRLHQPESPLLSEVSLRWSRSKRQTCTG